MYSISFAFLLPLAIAAALIYLFTYIATGLVIARLVPWLRERYRVARFAVPIALLCSAWAVVFLEDDWPVPMTLILLPLSAVGLILTRKMIPGRKVGAPAVLDDIMLNQSS